LFHLHRCYGDDFLLCWFFRGDREYLTVWQINVSWSSGVGILTARPLWWNFGSGSSCEFDILRTETSETHPPVWQNKDRSL
jgi:hypothetical protein